MAKATGKASIEGKVAELGALRGQPVSDSVIEQLRGGIGHRNNYITAKAAEVARDLQVEVLVPELVAAFERFLRDPVKSDPQCWAKTAIARTLAVFGYQDSELFLTGLRHQQKEPVWGGSSDTAGALRGACAQALVQCRELSGTPLLQNLLDLFADADKSVRYEAVRAIASVGNPAAALLLRLRARLGKDEPEVLGACFAGVLGIEGGSAGAWVASFLSAADELAAEAAFALGETRTEAAASLLAERLQREPDPRFRSTLQLALALTRQESAWALLLDEIASAGRGPEAALTALLQAAPSPELLARIADAVRKSGSPELQRQLAEQR